MQMQKEQICTNWYIDNSHYCQYTSHVHSMQMQKEQIYTNWYIFDNSHSFCFCIEWKWLLSQPIFVSFIFFTKLKRFGQLGGWLRLFGELSAK